MTEEKPAPRRLRFVVEYDGGDFVGWQRQDNGPSVQAALEKALGELTHEQHFFRGAGRTDSGVHATGQVAHTDIVRNIKPHGVLSGMNSKLPRTITVRSVEDVPRGFDARLSAIGKTYRYTIWNDRVRSSLRDRYSWHLRPELDVARMNEGAQHLVGQHDFAAFRAADCERDTTVRTMRRIEVTRSDGVVTIEVEGDAFLKNMVRIITGTLTWVGEGRLTPDDLARVRDSRDRRKGGITAPPHGLSLVHVDYPPLSEIGDTLFRPPRTSSCSKNDACWAFPRGV